MTEEILFTYSFNEQMAFIGAEVERLITHNVDHDNVEFQCSRRLTEQEAEDLAAQIIGFCPDCCEVDSQNTISELWNGLVKKKVCSMVGLDNLCCQNFWQHFLYILSDEKMEEICMTANDFEYKILDNGSVMIINYTGDDEKVVIPSEIDGKPVTVIEDHTFYECVRLVEAVICEGVENIGEDAFFDCYNMERITIPKSVNEIGEHAFGWHMIYEDEEESEEEEEEYLIYDRQDDFVIYCYANSAAEKYAMENGIEYQIIDE